MEALEAEPQQGGALQTAKDLFSGAVGGVAQVMIGTDAPLFVLHAAGGE